MFTKALWNATYKKGLPPKLTKKYNEVENHRFGTDYLFKEIAIPKEPYVSRLIQYFFIIKEIETQLQCLPEDKKSQISAFFAFSYLNQIWRTSEIKKDLLQLGVNPDSIDENQIVQSTQDYVKKLKTLEPKQLLAHFLIHVGAFMRDGLSIKVEYINPSNKKTHYKIPTNLYDFSFPHTTSRAVFDQMMKQVDGIELDEREYQEVFEQCKNIYETMNNVYNELCNLQDFNKHLAIYIVKLMVLEFIIGYMVPPTHYQCKP
jgi:heme oxygenase